MCKRDELLQKQQEEITKLQAELAALVADGNEYYADMVRQEIIVASSLARLIHKEDK